MSKVDRNTPKRSKASESQCSAHGNCNLHDGQRVEPRQVRKADKYLRDPRARQIFLPTAF